MILDSDGEEMIFDGISIVKPPHDDNGTRIAGDECNIAVVEGEA